GGGNGLSLDIDARHGDLLENICLKRLGMGSMEGLPVLLGSISTQKTSFRSNADQSSHRSPLGPAGTLPRPGPAAPFGRAVRTHRLRCARRPRLPARPAPRLPAGQPPRRARRAPVIALRRTDPAVLHAPADPPVPQPARRGPE